MTDTKCSDTGFIGTGWSFPPEFSDHGSAVKMVSDEADIAQSLQILLQTDQGQCLMDADFHCDLRRFMFKNCDYELLCQVKNTITQAILKYEARIDLEHVAVAEAQHTPGLLNIRIDYRIRSTNSRHNKVFPFYLNEGTNIKQTEALV